MTLPSRRLILTASALASLGLLSACERSATPTAFKSLDITGADYARQLALTDARTEQPFLLSNLKGRIAVVFFGYTHCPDVCPTTLGEYAALKERLGPDAGKIDLLFVTVDPERDTPAVLKDYLSSFGDVVLGLTGSRPQVDAMIRAFNVYARKAPGADGDYGMDHTASSFLFDAGGHYRGTIAYMEDQETALQKLKTLIAGS